MTWQAHGNENCVNNKKKGRSDVNRSGLFSLTERHYSMRGPFPCTCRTAQAPSSDEAAGLAASTTEPLIFTFERVFSAS